MQAFFSGNPPTIMTNSKNLESVFDSIISEPIDKFTPVNRNKLQTGELRQLINKEISSGALNPSHTSNFGEEYHIVNLPADYRELQIPYKNQSIYISNLTEEIKTILDKENPEVVARNLDTIYNHINDIRSFLKDRESQFLEKHNQIESSTEYIRNTPENYTGKIRNAIINFFIESRKESVEGIVDIERDITKSKDMFHKCEFNEAENLLDECLIKVDIIIVNLDLATAIIGTLEHGGGEIKIPEEASQKFLEVLINAVDSDKNTELYIDKGVIHINPEDVEEEEKSTITKKTSIDTSDVADEVVYLFKEIEGEEEESYLEKQTNDLPDIVCSQDILYEFESFCSRQTDIVSEVNVQENSPPGFISIKFIENLDSRSGMDELLKRASEEYN